MRRRYVAFSLLAILVLALACSSGEKTAAPAPAPGGAPIGKLTPPPTSTPLSATPAPTAAAATVRYTFAAKWGTKGREKAQLDGPSGIAVDSAGNVYVADRNNERVQKYSPTGSVVATFDKASTAGKPFGKPEAVAVNNAGIVYVLTNTGTVMKFNAEGMLQTSWGSVGTGDGQFKEASGIAVDGSGNVYVADRSNNRVQKFTADGAFVAKWGTLTALDLTQGPLFSLPRQIVLDKAGNIFVLDGGLVIPDRIVKLSATGQRLAELSSESGANNSLPSSFTAFTVDAAGNLYVGTTNRDVRILNPDGALLGTMGSEGSGDGQFSVVGGIAVAADGRVFVIDSDVSTFQVFAKAP